jgi:hypothetical protein
MYTFTKILFPIFLIIILSGCGVTGQDSGSSKVTKVTLEEISDFDIVEMVDSDRILIGSTYYEISEKTKMLKANNQNLLLEELKSGDLVQFEHEGYILLSFPGQGFATSVVLHNDTESLNVSESIRNFLKGQETGDILSTSIKELTDRTIILQFYEREVHGKKYEAQIDRATNKFTVKEIVNKEALEQERRSQEMAAAHPEGSTSGHITEIYKNGFRINMADYTFSEDIHFNNDLGENLNKDQFQIGSFVSVEYDKLESKSTIAQGILSELTLLTKEENPEVTKWIQSVFEGDLYQQPVIMFSYKEINENYYTIRVADLKDNTGDSFEMKYDIKSKTHTTTRNLH